MEVLGMEKKILSTENAPSAIGPYSQGVSFGDMIITSGQLPINPANGELVEDIKDATRQSLNNCKSILEAGGSSMDKIVKTTVFLRDINDFGAMNEAYAEFFGENPPARSAVQVAKIPKNAILEIEVMAIK